jgi:hypothetical protein
MQPVGPVTQDNTASLQTNSRQPNSGRVLHMVKPAWAAQGTTTNTSVGASASKTEPKPFLQAMQQASAPPASTGLVLSPVHVAPAAAVATGTATAPATHSAVPNQINDASTTAAGQDDTRVKKGDTLISVVQQAAAAQGKTVSNAQAWQMAKHLAVSNSIDNPNLIHPGQRLRMNSLDGLMAALPTSGVFASAAGKASGQVISTQAALALRMTTALSASSINMLQRSNVSAGGSSRLSGGHASVPGATAQRTGQVAAVHPAQARRLTHTPVLDKTLQRAVDKGFMSSAEVPRVQQKIVALAQKHKFSPDDFARLTLMESDGMNPKSTNGSCHGIIQFCDGDNRGAASVGFANNPRAILNMSTYNQLDLVDQYFDEVGVGKKGPVRLDDLYLSVLTPAARQETRRHVALDIAGTQATYLHVGKDRDKPITRQSIWVGLHHNANQRLRDVELNPVVATGRTARLSAYNTAQQAQQVALR